MSFFGKCQSLCTKTPESGENGFESRKNKKKLAKTFDCGHFLLVLIPAVSQCLSLVVKIICGRMKSSSV